MADLTPGLALCRDFYADAVAPVVAAVLAGRPHAAAVMGRGSEVLGFDDATSTDHDWRPRTTLFLTPEDDADRSEPLRTALAAQVPASFAGHPTGVEVVTVRGYFLDRLGVDVERALTARDWLATSEQQLAMYAAGAVFHDELDLQAVRDRLGGYPHDVWLYLMSAAWWRLHPEVNLVGRTGSTGDELGSALIGSRLVTDMARLCFLLERRYAPYPKWFGTAFARLACAAELGPLLEAVLRAGDWREREEALNAACAALARRHDALRVTPPVVLAPVRLWDRPFTVTWGDVPGALQAEIRDPEVRRLVERWPTGGVDQLREVLWHQRSRDQVLRALE